MSQYKATTPNCSVSFMRYSSHLSTKSVLCCDPVGDHGDISSFIIRHNAASPFFCVFQMTSCIVDNCFLEESL